MVRVRVALLFETPQHIKKKKLHPFFTTTAALFNLEAWTLGYNKQLSFVKCDFAHDFMTLEEQSICSVTPS